MIVDPRPLRPARQLYAEFTRAWQCRDSSANESLDKLAFQAQSDPEAYDFLLKAIQEHRLAHPAVRKILLSETAIEEAVQATLAMVALKLHLFEGKSLFATWLYRVASNEAKRVVRSEARTQRINEAALEPSYLSRLSSLVANREVVFDVMGKIDPVYSEPLRLREMDALTYEEIASKLDIPVGTVRSRLNRARRMVAAELKSQLGS